MTSGVSIKPDQLQPPSPPSPETSPLFIRGFRLLRPLPAPVSPSPLMETHMRKSASPSKGRHPEVSEPSRAGRHSSGRAAYLPDWATCSGLQSSRPAHGSASEAVGSSAADGSAPQSKYVMLSVAEYAALFRISTKTVRRMIDRGDLRVVRIVHSVRIPVSIDFVNTICTEPHCFR
jgi:excisionase family DNA binding protein